METITEILLNSWNVCCHMAPYLLFGFFMAGILSVLLKPEWVEKHLGGSGFLQVFKASLVGVPMPLCSCGVLPVATSLRNHGASRAATTSFLLSTPQTGVDSIAVTYALLEPFFAFFRPLTAFLTGILGGALVQCTGNGEKKPAPRRKEREPPHCTESCCEGKERTNVLLRALRYGFGKLPKEIGLHLVAGILIAGVIATFVQEKSLAGYIGGGALSILVMMAAGIPVYVCATASVPIAAGLMHAGASPGAALAFLIAGPATNAASFTTILKVLGKRTAFLYAVTAAASAFGFGLLLDLVFPFVERNLPELGTHTHETGGWFNHAAAAVLVLIILSSYGAQIWKRRSDG